MDLREKSTCLRPLPRYLSIPKAEMMAYESHYDCRHPASKVRLLSLLHHNPLTLRFPGLRARSGW